VVAVNLVFLGMHDWANTCNRISRSINKADGDMHARVVTLYRHPFAYPEQDLHLFDSDGRDSRIGMDEPTYYQWFQDRWDEARDILDVADWICLSGDGSYPRVAGFLKLFGIMMGDKRFRWARRHPALMFRNNFEYYQKCDREVGMECRFVPADLYRYVKDDPRVRVFAQAQDTFADAPREARGALRVCHTPSNREKKGTAEILAAMTHYDTDRNVDFHLWEGLSFDECYARGNTCDVYIDQHCPHVGGYGGAAMEALANGLAVVSNFSHVIPEVWEMIPCPPILPVRDTHDINRWITQLSADRAFLDETKQTSLAWARRYLAPEFTYAYWKEALS
jgi:hypothetical protein